MTEAGIESTTDRGVRECRTVATRFFQALLNADGSVPMIGFLTGLSQAQDQLLASGRIVRSETEFRAEYDRFSGSAATSRYWRHEQAHRVSADAQEVRTAVVVSTFRLNGNEAYLLPSIRMKVEDISRLVAKGKSAGVIIGRILDAPGEAGLGYREEQAVADYLLGRSAIRPDVESLVNGYIKQ